MKENELGASLVEYALLLLLIAVVVWVVVGQLGESASSSFGSAADSPHGPVHKQVLGG